MSSHCNLARNVLFELNRIYFLISLCIDSPLQSIYVIYIEIEESDCGHPCFTPIVLDTTSNKLWGDHSFLDTDSYSA